MLRDSTAVVRTCPGAIPLPMITTRKSMVMVMGLRLAALWAAGAPLIIITSNSYH